MSDASNVPGQLKNLECPFKWDMERIEEVIQEHGDSKSHDDEEFVPLLKWMRLLVNAFESVVKNNLTEANENIITAEECWENVKAEHADTISLTVLEDIFKGTKCYINLKSGQLEEVEKILKTTKDITYKENEQDRGTLNGCKCIAWSIYKEAGESEIRRAIQFAELAIKYNPDTAVWYFMLAKNLRRLRRLSQLNLRPTDKEERAFQRAYEISAKPLYGIFCAQLHKEKRNPQKALSIYKLIFNTKPESSAIRLRLALGFIRQKELALAKECLDYAEERFPDDAMFLHYKGIYLEALYNYKEAAEYYLKASKGKNFAAEMCYLRCKAAMKDGFQFVPYLENMLKTYATYQSSRELDILLQLAACCFFCNNDLPGAAKYYLQAFEKYPKNNLYKYHSCVLGGTTNIYDFLLNDFLEKAFKTRDLDANTKSICQKLKNYCEKDYSGRKCLESSFAKMRLSK